ncbi:MAG: DUF4910 domain-containing protein [Candidatus Thorarchaeota archaeon]|nr:DUF4910 domain-containing protein [Candidatus Thorarchaeota archaeon]
MLLNDLPEKVNNLVSGQRALDYVSGISQFHRIQGSPGIHDAIQYLKSEIEKVSVANVEIFNFEIDGKHSVGSWIDLLSWTPKSATLELIEPEMRVLADFEAEPISLAAQSISADLESEVIYVGKGIAPQDYEGKDVKGKVVLTEGRASMVHRIACVQYRAAGVLTFIPPKGEDPPNFRRYEGLWPQPDEVEKTGFGFALTQEDGMKLRDWLQEGKTVKVRARVDAQLKAGTAEVLSAVIEGKEPANEVWLIAHVCHPHPGANDNASGSGALMESLRVISRLIRDGLMEQPEFSIRFVWVPEWYGTIRLIDEHPDLVKRCRAVINADMVGADPAKGGSILGLYRTPFSLPTTMNAVVKYWLEHEADRARTIAVGGTLSPLPWKYKRYSAGSDHFMFTDSTLKIPAVMLNQFPDKFYHTSADTPDKIDPRQMAYASRVVTLSAITLAARQYALEDIIMTLSRDEIGDLMREVTLRGVKELACCVDDPEKIYPRYMRWMGYAQELGRETLDRAEKEWKLINEQRAMLQALKTSIDMLYMAHIMVLRRAYEGACAEVGLEAKDEELLKLDPSQFDLEVRRKLKYALYPGYVLQKMPEKTAKYIKFMTPEDQLMARVDELLNMSDDWRSLSDIFDRLCFEFGDMDPKVLSMLVDDLCELGVLEKREIDA